MKPPLGIDDFETLRQNDYTYVDKSLFIEEVIENPALVQLITRPRRFGKTLNMSMLAHFFDRAKDSTDLFKGLAITERPCFAKRGSHPVIFISFKRLKANDFEHFLGLFAGLVSSIYKKYLYLMDSLNPYDHNKFHLLASGEGKSPDLGEAISLLIEFLHKHHGQKVILLLDEYDSPIDEAFQKGFHDKVITFMRGVLGEALKGNTSLEKAILTGILRISRESIFSDLNNLSVYTVTDLLFDNSFGFTEDEVQQLLKDANRSDRLEEIRNWYNGYKIGNAIVYNPWSLINFIHDPRNLCQPYWVNTSSNHLIHRVLIQGDPDTHREIIGLINGGTVETTLFTQTTLQNFSGNALWSLLLHSGYLTVDAQYHKGPRLFFRVRIPNTEVKLLFQDVFIEWMNARLGPGKAMEMVEALIQGNIDLFATHFSKLVVKTLSYYDTAGDEPERVYHAFVLGLLSHMDYAYHIRSNRESGLGRYDLMMIPKSTSDRGVILEFKVAASESDLKNEAKAALAQIENKDYAAELEGQGIKHYTKIGIAFHGKQVKVEGANH